MMKIILQVFVGAFLFLQTLSSVIAGENQVDVVVFSYNRPLQLYACLESIAMHCMNTQTVYVIYRTDSKYVEGYEIVKKQFPHAIYYKQGANPKADFQDLVMKAVCNSNSDARYLMFAVDDMIVVDDVDLAAATRVLERRKDIWFFSLRLGLNINYCYMGNRYLNPPAGIYLTDEVDSFWYMKAVPQNPNTYFAWRLKKWHGDWGLGTSVDMAVYRKEEIEPQLASIEFTSPGALEAHWRKKYEPKIQERNACCFLHSKVINIPINLVQDYFEKEKCADSYSVDELYERFIQGKKIDICKLYKINNNSCHYPVVLHFEER